MAVNVLDVTDAQSASVGQSGNPLMTAVTLDKQWMHHAVLKGIHDSYSSLGRDPDVT